jgi:hypothetical protein
MQQRRRHPVRPIPSQLWCKNFGKKEYWRTFQLAWSAGTLLLPSFLWKPVLSDNAGWSVRSILWNTSCSIFFILFLFAQSCYMRNACWTQINQWFKSHCWNCLRGLMLWFKSLLYMWLTDSDGIPWVQSLICLVEWRRWYALGLFSEANLLKIWVDTSIDMKHVFLTTSVGFRIACAGFSLVFNCILAAEVTRVYICPVILNYSILDSVWFPHR